MFQCFLDFILMQLPNVGNIPTLNVLYIINSLKLLFDISDDCKIETI